MILAIDTASKTATVAITDNNAVIAELSVLSDKTHSKAVLPMIDQMFQMTERELNDIDYIACVSGPGSFTGLRIGAAVAKGIAYSLNKKIVPVSSLDALAYNVLIGGYTICPMIDARKKHVYSCFYKVESGRLIRLTDYTTSSIQEVIRIGGGFSMPLYLLGSGASMYVNELENAANAAIAPPHISMHRAGAVGLYAEQYAETLGTIDGKDFEPVYMSRSQAEEDNA